MPRPSANTVVMSAGVVAVFLAAVALLGTCYFAPEKFGDMVVQLAATFIGAVAALAVGIFLFRYQTQDTDDKRCDELRRLLRAELQDTIKDIDEQEASKNVPSEETGLIHIQPLVVEHVIRSGLFPVPFVERLLSLARQFHTYNLKVSRLLATIGRTSKFSRSRKYQQEVEDARWGVSQTAGMVKERCTAILRDPELL
jgi:hypothetical protein